jgi:hypothetical protein
MPGGRKTWDKELQSKNLWDLSIGVLKYALTTKNKKVSLNTKINVAQALVLKMCPVDNPDTHKTVYLVEKIREVIIESQATKQERVTGLLQQLQPRS